MVAVSLLPHRTFINSLLTNRSIRACFVMIETIWISKKNPFHSRLFDINRCYIRRNILAQVSENVKKLFLTAKVFFSLHRPEFSKSTWLWVIFHLSINIIISGDHPVHLHISARAQSHTALFIRPKMQSPVHTIAFHNYYFEQNRAEIKYLSACELREKKMPHA